MCSDYHYVWLPIYTYSILHLYLVKIPRYIAAALSSKFEGISSPKQLWNKKGHKAILDKYLEY